MRITRLGLTNTGWTFLREEGDYEIFYRLDADGRASFARYSKTYDKVTCIWRGDVPDDTSRRACVI